MQRLGKNLLRSFQNASFTRFSTQKPKKFFEIDDINEFIIVNRNYPGALAHILELFKDNRVNITNIETTLLNKIANSQQASFHVSFEGKKNDPIVLKTLMELQARFQYAELNTDIDEVPWFPRNLKDLELLGKTLLDVKDEVNKDHEQFKDVEYRKRRNEIAKVAENHLAGQPIPIVNYLPSENETWRYIYDKVEPYQKEIFVDRFGENFKKLEKYCGLSRNRIPQLKDIDEYLYSETGFRLKPVHGILSQREFLDALAHKVFCCTQYIRHHSKPEYTPEPDIIHEVIGHIPMFIDKEFAKLSQEFGLYSLGASDEQISMLGALYWYTIEFGSIKEKGKIKAYGGGIAGSFGECQNYISGKAQFKLLNPSKEFTTKYPIQDVQPIYYYNESFEQALSMILKFGKNLRKPMKCYYDENTKTVKTDRKIRGVETKQSGPLF